MKKDIFDICVITSVHDFNDDRIFHKQIKSFLEAGLRVAYLAKTTDTGFRHPLFSYIEITSNPGKLKRVFSVLNLLKKALKTNAKAYHLHDPELVLLGLFLKLNGKKVVYDVHEDYKSSILASNLPLKAFIANIWDGIEKTISKRFNLIICADSYIYSRFVNNHKIVIGNYPTLDFVSQKQQKVDDDFVIVYAGGVSKSRGIERLINAVKRINRENITLSIIGPCKDENLLKMMEEHNFINYHGKVDWTQVKDYLTKASVGVALYEPSINFTYCTGEGIVKIFEYMANGLPVITSNFPNLKNFIEGKDVGSTVDPMNIEAICGLLINYIDDPDLLFRQSENGRRIVLNNYNWENAAKELIEAYKQNIL